MESVSIYLTLFVVSYHWMISQFQEYTMYLFNTCDHVLSCSAAEHDQTEWESSLKNSWYDTHFSLLEMHTDNSTNCTLLGPVDCDSFYKWIPLNRWPGCHLIRGIAFYLLCLLYKSFIFLCSSQYSLFIYLPPNDRAGSKVWVWWQVYVFRKLAMWVFCMRSKKKKIPPKNTRQKHIKNINKFIHDQFVCMLYCRKGQKHTHKHTYYQFCIFLSFLWSVL